jgi:DNA-binding HxlR family transcriptional regulator
MVEESLVAEFERAISNEDRTQFRSVLATIARRLADSNRHGNEQDMQSLIGNLDDLQTRARRHAILEEGARPYKDFAWEATGMTAGVRMAAAELALTMVPAEARHAARQYRRVLNVLEHQGPIATSELMRVADVPRSTLSDCLRRLEKLQLVERVRYGKNEYEAQLTPFGESAYQDIAALQDSDTNEHNKPIARKAGQNFTKKVRRLGVGSQATTKQARRENALPMPTG